MNTTQARARFVSDGLAVLTGPRLLVALYERLVRDLDEASAAIDAGDTVTAHNALIHAQDIVSELAGSLDGSAWDGAGDLAELYEWTYHHLVQANIAKDSGIVDACRSVIAPLRDTWAEAILVGTDREPAAG
jgi:flagellar protein FliS